MRTFRPLFTIAILIGLSGVAFYKYARPVWHPLKLKLTGTRGTADVVAAVEPRVRKALAGHDLKTLTDGRPLALLAFKNERVLELWKQIKDKDTGVPRWRHIRDYPFTAYSGQLGPKLKQGDRQIPEGIYKVEYLNPNSTYYLSFKIDYPNAFDREKARSDHRTNLGGDIFIHGASVTIGCIPVGNRRIEELFYLVAKNGPAQTRVIISPYDMRKVRTDPAIESVSWETELYDRIAKSLEDFPKTKPAAVR